MTKIETSLVMAKYCHKLLEVSFARIHTTREDVHAICTRQCIVNDGLVDSFAMRAKHAENAASVMFR